MKSRRIVEELGRVKGRGRGRREEVGWREENVDRVMEGEKRERSKRKKVKYKGQQRRNKQESRGISSGTRKCEKLPIWLILRFLN